MSLEWKDIAGKVGKVAPLLGSLLGGPAGATVGAIIAAGIGTEADPTAIDKALTLDPNAAVKLAEIESTERVRLQELATQQAVAEIEAAKQATTDVNATMRAEAAAEHWPTWSWRPAIGFAVAFNIIVSSLLCVAIFIGVVIGSPVAATALGQLPTILGALAGINATALPILGVASWFRGKMHADPSNMTIQLPPGFGKKPS